MGGDGRLLNSYQKQHLTGGATGKERYSQGTILPGVLNEISVKGIGRKLHSIFIATGIDGA